MHLDFLTWGMTGDSTFATGSLLDLNPVTRVQKKVTITMVITSVWAAGK